MPLPIKPFFALAVGAALVGCAAGPNFKQPPGPAATAYSMQGDAALAAPPATSDAHDNRAWWRAFNAPALDAVMQQALSGNQDVAIAEANLRAAQAGEARARGGAWPQADANAGARREKVNPAAFGFAGFPGSTVSLYSVGGSVSYDLDLFGGRKRRIEGAAARRESATWRSDAAYLTLTGRVAQTVFEIASLRAQINALEAVVADDRQTVDMVHKAAEAGGAAPVETLSAQAQLAEDLGDLPELKQRLSAARHYLALLAGKAPAEWAAPDFDISAFANPPATPVSLPSALVRKRPDIMAAEAELHAASADVGVAAVQLYPNISLSAALTQTAVATTSLFQQIASGWSVGSGLTAPLFHGGALRADKHRAEAEADAALARYRQTVLTAFGQIADTLDALAHDDEELAARQAAVDSAGQNLRTARLGFEKGGANFLSVLDAQRQNSRAARRLAETQAKRLKDLGLLAVASAAPWRDR